MNRGEVCAGYGVLLSWPRQSDSRRAIVYTPETELPIHSRPFYFIGLGNRDIELALRLQDSDLNG